MTTAMTGMREIGVAPSLEPGHSTAIALDFDGVCKLFTEHKHQIMSTLLFLYFPEFQKASMSDYRKAYGHINFRSKEYAGKARFICVNALAGHLGSELRGLNSAMRRLEAAGLKANAGNLKDAAGDDGDVKRVLAWSEEVDLRLAQLTGIGLTPGIKDHILDAFRNDADFYLVSTATESSIRASMEREGVFFIKRYFGQETAGKTEALSILANAGYEDVFMFGDSVEDRRASKAAQANVPAGASLVFIPVVPLDELNSFKSGNQIIRAKLSGAHLDAKKLVAMREEAFDGNEAGAHWAC